MIAVVEFVRWNARHRRARPCLTRVGPPCWSRRGAIRPATSTCVAVRPLRRRPAPRGHPAARP